MNFYNRIVGDERPYVIAEIGANHNGDMELARELILKAQEIGCDAVKFQSWTPESLIAKEEYDRNLSYSDSPKKHFGSLQEMVEKYYLREDQHVELKTFADELGIDFVSTPFCSAEVDLLEKLDVKFYKIASMDINNLPFLKYVAGKGRPVVLSTGMASLSEIDKAVRVMESEGLNKIVLLHCISIYPPKLFDINLRNIDMLRRAFGYPVGFSDHTLGVAIPLAASALGARIIEKHFTLDKGLPGWDHEISADPFEMKLLMKGSAEIWEALGRENRIVSDAEREKRLKMRRSIVVRRDLSLGHVLTEDDLTAKRPGTGIPPDEIEFVIGRSLAVFKKADELLKWEDLK